MKNYIGEEIGKFEILNQKRENNNTYLYTHCKKCGRERWIASRHVKNTKCCEAKASSTQFKPLIPKEKFINNIELIEMTDKRKGTSVVWKCKCFCGNIFYTTINEIKEKRKKNCGCSKIRYTHSNLEKAIQKYAEKNLKEGTSIAAIKPKLLSTNTSGVTGVFWSKKRQKWIAQIEFQKKHIVLGAYKNKKDAIKARKEAEEKYFKPILDKYIKSYNTNKLQMVRNVYKDYLKSDNKSKIVINLSIFKKYFENKTTIIKMEQTIKELDDNLIKLFEKNHYIVYRENETYVENNVARKVKKGTAVAIKK